MKFKGELHKVKLINFEVDFKEVIDKVPSELKVFVEHGKAIISMVDVQLKKMSPIGFPFIKFGYRHVAFRLLIDDRMYSKKQVPQGIHFLQGFTTNPLLNWAGNLVGNYNLKTASFKDQDLSLKVELNGNYVQYELDTQPVVENDPELFKKIKRIDRAYGVEKNNVLVTKIAREGWPIVPINLKKFETNFFKTAKFLEAYEVKDVIDYVWDNPTKVNVL